jgi:hypothetical protein
MTDVIPLIRIERLLRLSHAENGKEEKK